jgi:hypothetical protein
MTIAKIKSLRLFGCASNLYPTEDLARLVAARPDIQGDALRPYYQFKPLSADSNDVLICGKRKPFLSSTKDRERIEKYVAEFSRLVEKYRAEFAGSDDNH